MSTSAIQDFYANKCIFITGASGFVGKAIVEKFLRECPGLSRIYMLLRPKRVKGTLVSPEERLLKFLQSSIFDTLRLQNPRFGEKIYAVSGDITFPELGLSPEDRLMLTEHVNIVIHSAATIKFTEPLNIALDINFKGTKRMLDLCLGMHRLQSFIHISTAYSNCDRDEVEELIYPPVTDAHKLVNDVSLMDAETIAKITPQLLGRKPNTYTYTKSLVENLLQEYKDILPISIVRPSIVSAAANEPVKGWIDNMNAASGLLVFFGKGLLRSINAHPDKKIALIPVDKLVNLVIAAAWSCALRPSTDITVYNCCPRNAIMYKDLTKMMIVSVAKAPFDDTIWYPSIQLVKSKLHQSINDKLLHHIPACIIDFQTAVCGGKPRMRKIYKRMKDAVEALEFFTTNEWKFSMENVNVLHNSLSPADQKLFSFTTDNLKWSEYMDHYAVGLRKYTCLETDANLVAAHKNMRRKFWIHKSVFILLIYIPILMIISLTYLLLQNYYY